MKLLTMIVFAVLAIGISMGAGKYNACHQDCCDRSFSNYNTINDTCNIDNTSLIYDDYVACMKICDAPKPTLYDTAVEETKNLTENITNPIVIVHPVQLNSTTATKTAGTTNTSSGSGNSGGLPFCAPAVAFLAIIGLLHKR
ncbi:MAG: hypothetical protein NTY68_04835 [Candidatus Micrarchaeota archaeon]|nr:hypothetical protein [Candidatus Micrarchaeota archaeon]